MTCLERSRATAFSTMSQSNSLGERIAQEDDLGDCNGKIYLPFAGESRCNVLHWRPLSVGTRPIDYVQRDSTRWAFFKHPRSVRPRLCVKHRPIWMLDGISGLTDRQINALVQYRTVHYYYGSRLLDLWNHSSIADRPLLAKIFACWPSGIEAQWQGLVRKTPRDYCSRPRFCPFCFAREASRIWSALREYRRRINTDRFLLYFSASVDLTKLTANLRQGNLREVAGLIRRELFAAWRERQSPFRPSGGLTSSQFGPSPSDVSIWQDGELTVSRFAGLILTVSSISELSSIAGIHNFDSIKSTLSSRINLERLGLHVEPFVRFAKWYHPDGPRDVMRRFLIAPNDDENAGRPEEFQGAAALSWEPWHLATAAQWALHCQVSKGKQLYSPWGTWKDQLEKSRPGHEHRSDNNDN